MSPLRPTNTSSPRAAVSAGVSPIGVMLCILATLVAVPLALSFRSDSGAEEVAVVAVDQTVSASSLEPDVDMDSLFDAGARVEEVPDVPVTEAEEVEVAAALVVDPDPSTVEAPASVPDPTTSTTISETPATAAPAPTSPPTTAAPTTAAPTTAAPTTAAPTTTAPPTTAAPTEPEVSETQPVEDPQGPEPEPEPEAPAGPTPEQWAALRHCESSGNYSVISRNGLYHGAYQFYQPTWDGLAAQVGRTDLVGLPPSQAAPADQDALALLLWQQRGSQPWPHCGRYLPAGP